jgi:hypothetical protein
MATLVLVKHAPPEITPAIASPRPLDAATFLLEGPVRTFPD